jgi:glycerate kinase
LEPVGENLIKVHQIDISQLNPALKDSKFMIACDVSNPFFGEEGAAYVYAPQKGANSFQVIELDNGLRHYAQVIKEYTNMDISQLPGAGAAGGMGGGLLPFLNAELQSGIEVILKTLRFEEVVRQADLILTGEGKLDRQTGMGKALDGILRVGEKCQVPVIALGGAVEATEALNRMGFTAVLPIQPFPVTLEEAMQPEFTKENIERTVRQVVRIIKQFTK